MRMSHLFAGRRLITVKRSPGLSDMLSLKSFGMLGSSSCKIEFQYFFIVIQGALEQGWSQV
jgi:hypothetical protein